MDQTNMQKADSLILQGICGFVVGFALASSFILESGNIFPGIFFGIILAGFPYGLSFFFFSDEPSPYYLNDSDTWIFISLLLNLLKFVAAYFTGVFIYPIVLVITLFRASRERKVANQNGANYGSPFQFFQFDLRKYTTKDCNKSSVKYIILLLLFAVFVVLFHLGLKDSQHKRFGILAALAMTGYLFAAGTIFYRAMHDSWIYVNGFAGCLFSVGIGVVYTCAAIDIGCIMLVATEHILDLGSWRISNIQKLQLVGAVGILLAILFFAYIFARLIYCRLRFKQLKREEVEARQRYMEELTREETEAERIARLEKEKIMRMKQRQSWEKMKKQRQLAEQRKQQSGTNKKNI